MTRGLALAFLLLTTNGCGDARPATTSDSAARDSAAADMTEPDADAIGPGTPYTDVDAGGYGACVSVAGGSGRQWLDLRIVGRQFDAYEGRRIRVVVSNEIGGRLGVADAGIESGAFELTIPGALSYGYYTEIALYVDDDADDACDVGEPIWGFVTGSIQDHFVVEATPDGPCISGGGPNAGTGCRQWLSPVAPCVVNGQAELDKRLPCP